MGIVSLIRRGSWKAATLAPGERTPLPRTGYGSFINGFESFTSLQTRNRPIDPVDANEGRDNAIVSICLHYIATSWQLAQPQVGAWDGSQFKPDAARHPLLDLLQNPNPHYDGGALMWSLLSDYWPKGNAYAHIVRDRRGEPLEINWIPCRYMRPIPDDQGYVSHYEYSPNGQLIALAPEDVIHIRYGVDPFNPLQGISPLASQYREIVTDNSYSDYAGGLAQHGGMPPIVFSPKTVKGPNGEDRVTMTEGTAKTIGQRFKEALRMEPGAPKFIPGSLDMHQLAFKPDDMALLDTRAMPETRIPAAFGLPVLVLQLYTGVVKSTFNNAETATKQAWRGCIIPNQGVFASAIGKKALVLYRDRNSGGRALHWDTGSVKELQEDNTALREQARKDHESGLITLKEARAEGGRQTSAADLAKLEAERVAAMPVVIPGDGVGGGIGDGEKLTIAGKTYFIPASVMDAIKKKSDGTVNAVKDIYTAAQKKRDALRAVEDSAVADIRKLYEIVEAGTEEKIATLEAEMKQAEDASFVVNEGWLLREESLKELLAKVKELLKTFGESAAPVVSDAQIEAAKAAADNAKPLAEAAMGTAPDPKEFPDVSVGLSWNDLPTDVLETLAGFMADGGTLADHFASLGTDAVAAMRATLFEGVATGEGSAELARRLRGVAGLTKARAETIARTEPLRAAREASRQSYEANSDVVTGYQRICAGDSRVCAACFALHGTEYPTSDIMPTHPCCRCVMVPSTKSWAELTGDDSIPDTRPEIASPDTLFGNLSESDQQAVMGPGGFDLWKAGTPLSSFAVVSTDAKWGPTVRVASLSELAGLAGEN